MKGSKGEKMRKRAEGEKWALVEEKDDVREREYEIRWEGE